MSEIGSLRVVGFVLRAFIGHQFLFGISWTFAEEHMDGAPDWSWQFYIGPFWLYFSEVNK